jgi:hypothetical protein
MMASPGADLKVDPYRSGPFDERHRAAELQGKAAAAARNDPDVGAFLLEPPPRIAWHRRRKGLRDDEDRRSAFSEEVTQ